MTEPALVALDTNILVYAEGLNDRRRQQAAIELMGAIGERAIVLPAQCLGELFAALVRKFAHRPAQAGERVGRWRDRFALLTADESAFDDALQLAGMHGFQFWDALILATAAQAGCVLLLSEDMQDGFVWKGLTVANPFAATVHPLFADRLKGPPL
jgi:predicted nucleic acid-binding protein